MVKCSPCMQLVQGPIPGPAKSNVIGKKCEGVRGRGQHTGLTRCFSPSCIPSTLYGVLSPAKISSRSTESSKT